MSKLDDIYQETHYANPPSGTIYAIALQNDFVYQAFKDELKDLLRGMIGEDEHQEFCPAFGGGNSCGCDDLIVGRNQLSAGLRRKVEEL